jgi:hypothetical protein
MGDTLWAWARGRSQRRVGVAAAVRTGRGGRAVQPRRELLQKVEDRRDNWRPGDRYEWA